jgi:hypothetical protein
MATKADFTPDEWKLLLQSPLVAGVAVADPSGLIGMMRESMASARALLQAKADPNADALVKAVAGEFETSEGRGLAQGGVVRRFRALKLRPRLSRGPLTP